MSDRPTLLLADDDPTITNSLAPFFERAGFHVLTAANGAEALEKAQAQRPDLIVLDVLMPRMDGREVLRRLRRTGMQTPTILLTQVGDAIERALALEEGADDYLNKPFESHELLARVRAVIRRGQGQPHTVLSVADLEVDTTARTVRRGAQVVPLSSREYALLEYLARREGQTVTRAEIVEHVYDFQSVPTSNVVDVYIGYLRRKIDQERPVKLIHTRRGLGYRLGLPE